MLSKSSDLSKICAAIYARHVVMHKGETMKKIMFLYHVKEREFEIIEMIVRQIKKKDPRVEIKIEEFYRGVCASVLYMPDVIVTIPPRDIWSSNYLTILKAITDAKVVSMVTEGYYTFSPQDIKTAVGYNAYVKELIDYYILWGPKTKEIFGRALLEDQKIANLDRIKVTGYAWYETDYVSRRYQADKRYIKMQEQLAKHKRNILIITGFQMADWSIREYQLLGCFGDNKPLKDRSAEEIECAEKSIAAEWEFRNKYIKMIASLAKFHPEVGILVKLHPVEISDGVDCYDKLSIYPNVMLIKENIPLACMLNKIDFMIHYNSTCHFEAYIYKVPTIQMYDDSVVTELTFAWQTKSNSTYLVHIDDFATVDSLITENAKFRQLVSMDKIIYELFNWQRNVDYRPIEEIAYYITDTTKPQHLRYLDREVFKAIRSREGQEIIDKFLWNMLKKMGSNQGIVKDVCVLFRLFMYTVSGKLLFALD